MPQTRKSLKKEQLSDLLQRSRDGEVASFEEVVRRFSPTLLKRAFTILGDTHLAEDAVQETFLEAHSKLSDLKHNEAFASWTGKILFKYCNRITRREAEIPQSPDSLTNIEDNRPRADKTSEIIADLVGLDYYIANAFFIEGKPQKEIADELKIPLHTVKNRLKKTRRDLRANASSSAYLMAA